MTEVECARCGERFPFDETHTEITRRDFDERPQPKVVEYLCRECLGQYSAFLDH